MRVLTLSFAILMIPVPLFADEPQKFTPEQTEKLNERDRLGEKARARYKAGDQKGTIAFIEQALALEREVLGATHPETLGTVRTLAQLYEYSQDYDSASKWWKELLARRTDSHGKDHWETTDARLGLQSCERMAGLGVEQRLQLSNAHK